MAGAHKGVRILWERETKKEKESADEEMGVVLELWKFLKILDRKGISGIFEGVYQICGCKNPVGVLIIFVGANIRASLLFPKILKTFKIIPTSAAC